MSLWRQYKRNMRVENLRCPGCGHPVSGETKQCEYCGRIIEITSFSEAETLTAEDLKKNVAFYNSVCARSEENVAAYLSRGICFLKLKAYKNALESFDKAISIDFSNAEAYFYAAVSVLEGKIPFVQQRAKIDLAENYMENAVIFGDKGIYRYFMAFIRYDYHYRKSFCVKPDYKEYLLKAKTLGVSSKDIANLFKLLNLDINRAI